MSFYEFTEEDIINTDIYTEPSYTVELNGNKITGSIFLEKKYLSNALLNRNFYGFSAKEGGFQTKTGPFTSSIHILDVEDGATNKRFYKSIRSLYDYYNVFDSNYTANYTGSDTTRFRVITVPEIYYDRSILTGSFTASDLDSAGDERKLFDDGRGGIYSGSLTGTLVGNIFYNEGFIVLKGGGLNDEAASNDFGEVSPTNFKWRISFKGNHTIPVKIFRCRAPAGQLNATTNPTYYTVPSGSGVDHKNEKLIVLSKPMTYITTIGLYNDNYELVGMARTSQPIKKESTSDLLFRIRLDM